MSRSCWECRKWNLSAMQKCWALLPCCIFLNMTLSVPTQVIDRKNFFSPRSNPTDCPQEGEPTLRRKHNFSTPTGQNLILANPSLPREGQRMGPHKTTIKIKFCGAQLELNIRFNVDSTTDHLLSTMLLVNRMIRNPSVEPSSRVASSSIWRCLSPQN